jgi:hypothetical protein
VIGVPNCSDALPALGLVRGVQQHSIDSTEIGGNILKGGYRRYHLDPRYRAEKICEAFPNEPAAILNNDPRCDGHGALTAARYSTLQP